MICHGVWQVSTRAAAAGHPWGAHPVEAEEGLALAARAGLALAVGRGHPAGHPARVNHAPPGSPHQPHRRRLPALPRAAACARTTTCDSTLSLDTLFVSQCRCYLLQTSNVSAALRSVRLSRFCNMRILLRLAEVA